MVPLTECPEGAIVRIVGLSEDPRCRGRLCSMGLTPGTRALVRQGGSCCRIRVRGGELCLGSDMACQIMVSPA